MSVVTRRAFVGSAAGVLAASAVGHSLTHRPQLTAGAFKPLPLGEIRPTGWLRGQLRIQADGLGGHLDEFWPDVGPNSGWLGGTGESWERGPYFVDGLLPLAWQLDDAVLKAKALRFVRWTLDHQRTDGMIGPTSNDDWWPRMVMVKVLAQYHDATGDPQVLSVLTRYFHYQLTALPAKPLRDWGKYRWQDQVLVVEWLYERTGDPELLRLASLLAQQGFDWVGSFKDFKHTGPTTRAYLDAMATGGNSPAGMETHGVNNGQALKTAAVLYRLTGDPAGHSDFTHQLAMLDRYHGMPNGLFSCDEHLAGLNPNHGSELCTVVETLFSLQVALATFGDASLGDRIETIAYNALPGTFTEDMWAHQYDGQPNQVEVSLHNKPWTTNGPESNLYGLEPNFGCCTANFHQGWPKLAGSLWMRSADGGLAAALYAPCEVQTSVAGQSVHLAVETEYPFRETVRITVTPSVAARFRLHFRIPGWAAGAILRVNGRDAAATLTQGTFATVDRVWNQGDRVDLQFPMIPSVARSFHNSVVLSCGPLIYALDPGESWVKLRERGLTADWQVFPRSAWNYGLQVDEQSAPALTLVESPVGPRPFSLEGAPVRLHVRGRRLNHWRAEDGVAGILPEGLQTSEEPDEVLELVPYGATRLRITAFPQLQS